MKTKPLSLLTAGVVGVLTLVGWTASAEKPSKSSQVWEYKVVRLCGVETGVKAFGSEGWELKSSDLDALGKEGWELTSATTSRRYPCPSFYFKRAR